MGHFLPDGLRPDGLLVHLIAILSRPLHLVRKCATKKRFEKTKLKFSSERADVCVVGVLGLAPCVCVAQNKHVEKKM
jgi:hypothetical protein